MIKKLGNTKVTSNMKKIALLRGYELVDKQRVLVMNDFIDEDEKELIENDYFLQVHGRLLNLNDFNDASFELFEEWVNKTYPKEILEDNLILYICNGMNYTVTGAVVVQLYNNTVCENGHFVIYNFKAV